MGPRPASSRARSERWRGSRRRSSCSAAPGPFRANGDRACSGVGVREARGDRLKALRDAVLGACSRAGVDPGPDAERPYRPHVTVARTRNERARVEFPGGLRSFGFEQDWRPSALELIESRPVAGGAPSYPAVATVPLAGAEPGP